MAMAGTASFLCVMRGRPEEIDYNYAPSSRQFSATVHVWSTDYSSPSVIYLIEHQFTFLLVSRDSLHHQSHAHRLICVLLLYDEKHNGGLFGYSPSRGVDGLIGKVQLGQPTTSVARGPV
jgi:hypothetical protein